jgi:hypothetical protein
MCVVLYCTTTTPRRSRREGVLLATLDTDLAAAAHAENIVLLGEPPAGAAGG